VTGGVPGFSIWGLGLLLGYGAMWLTVRGQRPFHGPPPAARAALERSTTVLRQLLDSAGQPRTLDTRPDALREPR
jgi:hypothetical protein